MHAGAGGGDAAVRLTWTATKGKLDTIYLTGNPGGHLTIVNTCSGGAPSLDRTNIVLRAVISGRSASMYRIGANLLRARATATAGVTRHQRGTGLAPSTRR